jgi:EAL domain-containing protein (putative c-di-GMP-specific phosphodiesterase class I)
VQNVNLLNDDLKLIIQPCDPEMEQYLYQLGFKPIATVPQLFCKTAGKTNLADLFLEMSHLIPDSAQIASRFLVTQVSLDSKNLLIEFLNAQPLSSMTLMIKNSWFLQVLARQHLFFKYQPIFDLATGQVVAHECLARAKSNQGQCFSGQQLIDAALLMNLTFEFDELARSTCLESLAKLCTRVGTVEIPQTFFVNVLPNAIARDPKTLEQNFQQVMELGLRPEQIVFELTEVEALENHPHLSTLIDQIRDWGFGLAIDDLGSNVAIDHYCMEFRPDVIKLDRRLIHGCSRHVLKQVMIKSLLQFAHELGIVVLAEGLEDASDVDFCRDLGVDLGQGFGLATPEVLLWHARSDLSKPPARGNWMSAAC